VALTQRENAVQRFVVEPAASDPTGVAVVDAVTGQAFSRQEMLDGARRAAAMLTDLGLQPEQRLVMVAADSPTFLWFFWGAMWLGAVPVPVSTMLTEKDYRFLLADSRAAGLVVSEAFAPAARPAAEGQRALRFVIDDDPRLELPPPTDAAPYPSSADDVAFWLYTSGTTGFPKGAMHRHVDLGACTDAYARGILDMGPADRSYSVAKLFFAYGLGNTGYFPPGTGGSAILNPGRPVPGEVADQVRRHRPTLFFAVPTFFAALLQADLPADTFASVRLAISAGEPLPAELHRRFQDRFGVEVLDGLGTTELAHIFISNRPGRSVPGTTGLPVPGYDVELRDEAGQPVADGEPGRLWVAGESVMTGYWNRTDRNREVLNGRFIATGDTYCRNADGTYTCLGRTDDMLKVGGIWVSPAEVEACIVEMPDVAAAAVVGAFDESELVKPKAFVVPAAGADRAGLPERVQQHVRSRLAPFKYPRWVELLDELPTTATGKVKRYLLR
jgi:benzoate-CoA ligase